MHNKIWLSTVLIALTVPAVVTAKDLTLRQRITGPAVDAKPREQTVYITDSKRVTDDAHSREIIDITAKTATSIDKEHKTYAVRTFDELRTQADQMRKRVDNLPPEARGMMSRMLGSEKPIALNPTGKTAKIAGYETKEYSIDGDMMTGSVWATEALQVPAAGREWEKVGGALGGTVNPGYRLGEALAKLNGTPMKVTLNTVMAQKITLVSEVLEVKEKSPPPDVLTPPKDFKKLSPN